MSLAAGLAVVIFALTLAGIITERVHKTVVALCGGAAMIILGIVSQDQAFDHIDLGVIFLLAGMMIIVHFLAESGFFGYIAICMAQVARGRPGPLIILLCLVTGALCALVDNVTTVILIAPIVFLITDRLEVRPEPYLLITIFSANIGGAATLIGNPPNILIGSAAHLSYNAFLIHLAPVSVVSLAALAVFGFLTIRGEAFVSSDIRARIMELNARSAIRDTKLLVKTLSVLGTVLAIFLLHDLLGLEPATVALAGAAVLLLVVKADPEKAFRAVEWPTLFFFIGLFLLVSGLAAAGVLEGLAQAGLRLSAGSLLFTSMIILWFAAVASAFVGNVPITTALIPVVHTAIPELARATEHSEDAVSMALWWALALGACFGGNATVYASAANLVVLDIARKNRRHLSFAQFLRHSLPITLASLIIASIYVALRYVW